MKKILISSACLSTERSYDIAAWKKKKNLFSLSSPMLEHFGLRFLKANIPSIEILEYPTKEEFKKRLTEGWDVVGISFYINESNEAVEMADIARKNGVKEIWGGNYGALTPWVQEYFDKIVTGWGESQILNSLGERYTELIHPPIYMDISYGQRQLQKWGVVFTTRGCNKTCSFCQTPRFYRKPHPIDLKKIENVLKIYKQQKVDQIIILDENFGHFEEQTDSVIHLMKSFGFRWNPLTRVDTLFNNYDKWIKSGLCGASIGVESLNQDSLDGARKGNSIDQTKELLLRMKKDNLFTQVFYIIGFEQDTEDSIRKNILELKKYNIDAPQIQILTPYPTTVQYKYIEDNYGIFDKDLSKYDSTHLVWNHPNISPAKMRELLFWSNDTLYTKKTTFITLKKMFRQKIENWIN